ncbi:trypco2 family protein [Nonomuraea sp. NPDC049400]|uniref:trypco2 family protein n=1 Tax=Nonomuraea sp. NPDC049400 TaxID=3364352 RepID=UPI00378F23EC
MIELTTAIKELRAQLTGAIENAKDEELRFELGPIELELSIAATQEDGLGGKIRFWILSADGNTKETSVATQKVKLTLEPKVANSTTTPWISGSSGDRER